MMMCAVRPLLVHCTVRLPAHYIALHLITPYYTLENWTEIQAVGRSLDASKSEIVM